MEGLGSGWEWPAPDVCHPAVMSALRKAEDTAAANLFVHQYQTAVMSMGSARAGSNNYGCGTTDLFDWRPNAGPSSKLEYLAMSVLIYARVERRSHADAHVAIAGLAQLGALIGESWDTSGTGGYTILPGRGR